MKLRLPKILITKGKLIFFGIVFSICVIASIIYAFNRFKEYQGMTVLFMVANQPISIAMKSLQSKEYSNLLHVMGDVVLSDSEKPFKIKMQSDDKGCNIIKTYLINHPLNLETTVVEIDSSKVMSANQLPNIDCSKFHDGVQIVLIGNK